MAAASLRTVVLVGALGISCGGGAEPEPTVDASSVDAGRVDAGRVDAARVDGSASTPTKTDAADAGFPPQPTTFPDGPDPGTEGDGDFVVPGPYAHGPDSMPQKGVPQGKLVTAMWPSRVYGYPFMGTIYVPAQYTAQKPAALMIFQDGDLFDSRTSGPRTLTVFDNLIHKKEMPITIGVFIDPVERSREYDSVNDRYARFVVEDLLPALKTSYNITDDPRGRAIGGFSSGGICAFGVAWFRPDAFRKVWTNSGSFVKIRGGDKYPEMIRAAATKPLRVTLHSGATDLDNQFGHWPTANMAMAAALKEKGYHYRFMLGDEGHSFDHAGPDLPDSLRWLWREYRDQF